MGKRSKLPDIYLEIDGNLKKTWHVIKLSSLEEEDDKGLKLSMELVDANIPDLPERTSLSATAVVGGSKIYVCGGYSDSSPAPDGVTNKVYYVDVSDPRPHWKEAPPMISSRVAPYAFAYQDKICVLSGYYLFAPPDEHDGTIVYGEFYDPNSPDKEGWKVLARAKPDANGLSRVIGHALVLHNSDLKILFHTGSLSHLCGILPGSPYIFYSGHTFPRSACASALLDGVIYYIDSFDFVDQLYAYNLNDPSSGRMLVKFTDTKVERYFPFRVPDPWGDFWGATHCAETKLVALDDNKTLAVIWAHDTLDGLCVYCSILEVSKKDNNCFEAKVLGCSKFDLRQGTLSSCLPVLPRHEDVVRKQPRHEDVRKQPRHEDARKKPRHEDDRKQPRHDVSRRKDGTTVGDAKEMKRHEILCDRFRKVAGLGAVSYKRSEFVLKMIDYTTNELLKEEQVSVDEQLNLGVIPSVSNEVNHPNKKLLSPDKVRSKGRPPSKRKISKEEHFFMKKSKKAEINVSSSKEVGSTLTKCGASSFGIDHGTC